MTHHCKTMRLALQLGLGAALLASAAFISNSAKPAEQVVFCAASSATSPIGIQYARLSISSVNPKVCVRELLGVVAPPSVPNCWTAARNAGFDCSNGIIDAPEGIDRNGGGAL